MKHRKGYMSRNIKSARGKETYCGRWHVSKGLKEVSKFTMRLSGCAWGKERHANLEELLEWPGGQCGWVGVNTWTTIIRHSSRNSGDKGPWVEELRSIRFWNAFWYCLINVNLICNTEYNFLPDKIKFIIYFQINSPTVQIRSHSHSGK